MHRSRYTSFPVWTSAMLLAVGAMLAACGGGTAALQEPIATSDTQPAVTSGSQPVVTPAPPPAPPVDAKPAARFALRGADEGLVVSAVLPQDGSLRPLPGRPRSRADLDGRPGTLPVHRQRRGHQVQAITRATGALSAPVSALGGAARTQVAIDVVLGVE